jgi:hypothetical protein
MVSRTRRSVGQTVWCVRLYGQTIRLHDLHKSVGTFSFALRTAVLPRDDIDVSQDIVVGRKCDHIQGVVLKERLPWDTKSFVMLSSELEPKCSDLGYNTRKHGGTIPTTSF